MHSSIKATPDTISALALNRHLFAGDGDAFARQLALLVRENRLVIGEAALQQLIEAVRSVR